MDGSRVRQFKRVISGGWFFPEAASFHNKRAKNTTTATTRASAYLARGRRVHTTVTVKGRLPHIATILL